MLGTGAESNTRSPSTPSLPPPSAPPATPARSRYLFTIQRGRNGLLPIYFATIKISKVKELQRSTRKLHNRLIASKLHNRLISMQYYTRSPLKAPNGAIFYYIKLSILSKQIKIFLHKYVTFSNTWNPIK